MAEDQTAQEDRQDSEEQEAEGQAPEESQEQDEETQASAEESGTDDSDEEEEGADERGESEGKIGDVDIDEVDPNEPTQDDDVAAAQMRKLEREGPPENLGDWPTGKAMYLTFGGSEGGEGYEEGSPRQMGPSSLRHYPDGSVEVQGEMVDNPEDYKAEKTVFEEHEELGMDKGAKSDNEGGGDSGDDSADDSAEGEDSASSEGEDSTSAEGDGSQPEGEETEKAEAS